MGVQGRRRFPLCKSVSTFVQPPSRCCSPSQCCCPDCPRAGPLAHGQQARRCCDGNGIAPSWVRVPCQSPGGESCPAAFAPSSTALVGFGLCRPSPGAAPAWGPLPFDLWEPSVGSACLCQTVKRPSRASCAGRPCAVLWGVPARPRPRCHCLV